MLSSKDQVIASLVQAKSNLNQALEDLDRFPAFDPGTIAHSNCVYHTLTKNKKRRAGKDIVCNLH